MILKKARAESFRSARAFRV